MSAQKQIQIGFHGPENCVVLGTCSNCGGPVVIPNQYLSISQPKPRCLKCGASASNNFGPIIQMGPPNRIGD